MTEIDINTEIMWTINFHFECLNTRRVERRKKRSSLLLWFQSKCDLGHFTSNAMTVVFKTLKQRQTRWTTFQCEFYYFDSTMLFIHSVSHKTSTLGHYSKKNGSFLITFTLILHLNEKTPKPRILFLKEAFTNIKKR